MAGALLAEQAKWTADQVDFPDECVESFFFRDKILVSIMESDWQQLQFVFKSLERMACSRQVLQATGIGFVEVDRSLWSKTGSRTAALEAQLLRQMSQAVRNSTGARPSEPNALHAWREGAVRDLSLFVAVFTSGKKL